MSAPGGNVAEVHDSLTPETLELRLADRALGDDGILAILRRLAVYRYHAHEGVELAFLNPTLGIDDAVAAYQCPYSADECAALGVREMDLRNTRLTIPGMCYVFAYAALDANLVSVDLSGNSMADWYRFLHPAEPALDEEGNPKAIQIPDETQNIYTMMWNLAESHVAELRLDSVGMSAEVVDNLLKGLGTALTNPVETLSLRGNRFGEDAVRAITASSGLKLISLELEGCGLSLAGMESIVRSFENNYSICQLSLVNDYEEFEEGYDSEDDASVSVQGDDPAYDSIRARCVALGNRNYELRQRVGRALKRVITPARILLHPAATSPTPIAALPPNVLDLVLKHTSGDPGALTSNQWASVLEHAHDRSSILKAARRAAVVTRSPFGGVADDDRAFEDWRRTLGCAYWKKYAWE
ncbi:hypothetical protein Q8F55_005929 [Vanrija albida]|uniref:F-box domain-containing protein n=1 Tax=Vanrija albida TaxID=181172 RepID=A0ABR3Q2Z8_9TREE